MRKFILGFGKGPPPDELYNHLNYHKSLRQGNGWLFDYSNETGSGYGDGYHFGDGCGNNSHHCNEPYPYDLIQYWK